MWVDIMILVPRGQSGFFKSPLTMSKCCQTWSQSICEHHYNSKIIIIVTEMAIKLTGIIWDSRTAGYSGHPAMLSVQLSIGRVSE